MAPEFKGYPKLHRLNRDVIISEKIDGTNAAVVISDDGYVYAQSRKRFITPQDDNFGFAAWVSDYSNELRSLLGPGCHHGEWWGQKIQRGYGLLERRFSLFDTKRWTDVVGYDNESGQEWGLHVVPYLYEGPFSTNLVNGYVNEVKMFGSHAAPGWPRAEGIVVWHVAGNVGFKVTCEDDEVPKSTVK